MRVGGAWHYLDRGVDSNGDTLDFLLRATRDRNAAIAFFRKTVGASHTTPPRVVNVDKNPAYPIGARSTKHEGFFPTTFVSPPMHVSEQRHRARPAMHQTPHPADAGVQAVHHGVADRPRYRDNACASQGAGAVDGEGRRGRSDAPDPQGVQIGRVARSTQRTLARDPKRCNRTPDSVQRPPRHPIRAAAYAASHPACPPSMTSTS